MKILKLILTTFIFLLIATPVFAQSTYTITDVATHNTPQDCWTIFENNVYDLTTYLTNHDRFMDIREWCGTDMTEDFITKAGEGRDHKSGSYTLLEQYYIGTVVAETVQETNTTTETDQSTTVTSTNETKDVETNNPYNLILPLVLTTLLYWGSYFFVSKEQQKELTKIQWLLEYTSFLTLLIPALGFGIFMMLRYQFPNLWDIQFDFMYWHVEISLVMGVIAINHLLQRFKTYWIQLTK